MPRMVHAPTPTSTRARTANLSPSDWPPRSTPLHTTPSRVPSWLMRAHVAARLAALVLRHEVGDDAAVRRARHIVPELDQHEREEKAEEAPVRDQDAQGVGIRDARNGVSGRLRIGEGHEAQADEVDRDARDHEGAATPEGRGAPVAQRARDEGHDERHDRRESEEERHARHPVVGRDGLDLRREHDREERPPHEVRREPVGGDRKLVREGQRLARVGRGDVRDVSGDELAHAATLPSTIWRAKA